MKALARRTTGAEAPSDSAPRMSLYDFMLSIPWPVKAMRKWAEIWFRSAEEPAMEVRQKAQCRRQLVDRQTREERRMGLERLFDHEGRSDEDIRRDASEWCDELDRRYAADQRSAVDRWQRPDRRKT